MAHAVLLNRNSQQRLLTPTAGSTGGHYSADYECRSDRVYEIDIPDDFKHNETAMCGLSFPSDTPWTNLSACCTGPVRVYNECFQYCASDKALHLFGDCVLVNTELETPILTTCNMAARPEDGPVLLPGLRWMAALMWLADLAESSTYLLVASFGLLVASLAACRGTAPVAARRKLWAGFGVLLTMSLVMALYERGGGGNYLPSR